MRKIFINTVLLLICISAKAQDKKIMMLPERFDKPLLFKSSADGLAFIIEKGKPSDEKLWMIINDRENNPTYKDANESGEKLSFLKFGEVAYVIEEKQDLVLLAKGSIDRDRARIRNAQILGWVNKNKILLWSKSLSDQKSKILVKAFLFYKAKDLGGVNKDGNLKQIKFYSSPDGTNKTVDKALYSAFFVYKQEGDRFLLGANNFITDGSKETILGWVDKSKVTTWNTRLVLEPNYDEAAYNERKNNKALEIKGFEGLASATNCYKGDCSAKSLWNNDPVGLDGIYLDKTKRRHKGEFFRFPVLGVSKTYYYTASVNEIKAEQGGSIDEPTFSEFESDLKDLGEKRENLNIIFLVEATRGLTAYKNAILDAIGTADYGQESFVNPKYGVVLYRDIKTSAEGSYDCKVKKLTGNRDEVVKFVNDDPFFQEVADVDEYTTMRYGMLQALKAGGFSTSSQNLLVVIGNGADFYFDGARQTVAKNDPDQKKYLVPLDTIENQLKKLKVSMLFMQPNSQDRRFSQKFLSDARGFIVESSNGIYEQYFSQYQTLKPGAKASAPEMPDLESSASQSYILKNGVQIAEIHKSLNTPLSGSYIAQQTKEAAKQLVDKTDKLYQQLNEIIKKGKPIDEVLGKGMEWSPEIIDAITQGVAKNKNLSKKEIMDVLIKEKIKLHNEIYVPKTINGATNDLYKYGVFMAFEELQEYIGYINNLKRSMAGTADTQREALYGTMENLVRQLSGETSMNAVQNFTMDDIRLMLSGISDDSGFKLDGQFQFSLGNIRDKRIVKDNVLHELSLTYTEKHSKLSAIAKQAKNYEFAYSIEDAIYFWIPAELLF